MKNRFVDWANKKYTKRQRFIALIPEGIFFLVILPYFLFSLSFIIDRWFLLPKIILEPLNLIFAILLAIIGLLFALWTIWVQFNLGDGTPAPMMPTHKLLIGGPYIYCRNPMYFGAIILYLGVVVFTGSLFSFGILILMTLALFIYIKYVEEKELEIRFGKEYLNYKKETSFFIPSIRK